MNDTKVTPGETTVLEPKIRNRKPPLYRVLLHNDNYTTMEFVVEVLSSIFNKSMDDAIEIMLNVHHNGIGVAGVYPKSIAETKISQVDRRAQAEGFPLKCSTEPD